MNIYGLVLRERDYRSDYDDDSYGSGRSSHSRARTDYSNEKTASFDSSKIVGENGTFMGAKLDPTMADGLRFIVDQFIPHVAKKVGSQGARQVMQYMQKNGATNAEALAAAKKANAAIGLTIVGSEQIAGVANAMWSCTNSLRELHTAITPIMRASGKNAQIGTFFRVDNNEVINNARSKIMSVMAHDIVNTAAHSISVVPKLMNWHSGQKEVNAQLEDALEREMLAKATPEEYQAYLKKNLGDGYKDRATFELQKKEILKQQKELYEKDFEKFKRNNLSDIRKKFIEEYNSTIGDEYYNHSVSSRRRIDESRPNSINKIDDAAIKKSDFLKSKLEQKVREEYAAINEPWDETFLPEGAKRYGADRPKTMKEKLIATLEERDKQSHDKKTSHGGEPRTKEERESANIMQQGWQFLGTAAGNLMSRAVTGAGFQQFKTDIALDKILHLRRSIEENQQRDTIPSRHNSHEDYSFAQYVHKIFQQHQHDCKAPEIGERNYTNFRDASWNDERIQKMDDKDLSAYEVAVKHISKRLKDGRMDALALINLVGERKIVNSSGKSFGSQGKQGDEAAIKDGILKEIDAQCALLKPHHALDQDKLSEQMADFTFTPEELRVAFSEKGLKGAERAFLFALLESSIPDEKALHALTGLPTGEMEGLRKEAQGRFGKLLSAAVQELDALANDSPDALSKLKLTEEEVSAVQHVARELSHNSGTADDLVAGEEKKRIETTVANVMIESPTWRERVMKRQAENEKDAVARKESGEFSFHKEGKNRPHRDASAHDGRDHDETSESRWDREAERNGDGLRAFRDEEGLSGGGMRSRSKGRKPAHLSEERDHARSSRDESDFPASAYFRKRLEADRFHGRDDAYGRSA